MYFMDVIMGDIPIYNLTTLCLNGTLPCVDFMDVIMGDIYRYITEVSEQGGQGEPWPPNVKGGWARVSFGPPKFR